MLFDVTDNNLSADKIFIATNNATRTSIKRVAAMGFRAEENISSNDRELCENIRSKRFPDKK